MERLTDKDTNKVCFDMWELCGLDSVCKRDCYKPTLCKIPKIIRRLAEFEDKLESGQLVELPCKVGDTVYYLWGDKVEEYTIDKIGCDSESNWYFNVDDEDHFDHYFNDKSEIGIVIFFDKAQAETRLKELQEKGE